MFQTVVHPFQPVIIESEDLEALICSYLEAATARENPNNAPDHIKRGSEDMAHTSLILAVLASGAQFTDHPTPTRITVARDFGMTKKLQTSMEFQD